MAADEAEGHYQSGPGSLGFTVRVHTSMASSLDDIQSTLSGGSEGFKSAQTTPVITQRYGEDFRTGSAVSVDSASFHTPEPYDGSSLDEEDMDIPVDIPDFEAPPTRAYVPDQPKLDLAEGVGGGMSKPPLVNEHKIQTIHSHHESQRQHDHSHFNERTPLIQNSNSDKTQCCVLL